MGQAGRPRRAASLRGPALNEATARQMLRIRRLIIQTKTRVLNREATPTPSAVRRQAGTRGAGAWSATTCTARPRRTHRRPQRRPPRPGHAPQPRENTNRPKPLGCPQLRSRQALGVAPSPPPAVAMERRTKEPAGRRHGRAGHSQTRAAPHADRGGLGCLLDADHVGNAGGGTAAPRRRRPARRGLRTDGRTWCWGRAPRAV